MYDRNVRISRPQREDTYDEPRRSKRIQIPTKPYNCGIVACCVCNKRFRDDIPIDLYGGAIVCSVECMNKAD